MVRNEDLNYYRVDVEYDHDGSKWGCLLDVALPQSDNVIVATPPIAYRRAAPGADLGSELRMLLSHTLDTPSGSAGQVGSGTPASPDHSGWQILQWTPGALKRFVIEQFETDWYHQGRQPLSMPFVRLRRSAAVVAAIRSYGPLSGWFPPEAPQDPAFYDGDAVVMWTIQHEGDARVLVPASGRERLRAHGLELKDPVPARDYPPPLLW